MKKVKMVDIFTAMSLKFNVIDCWIYYYAALFVFQLWRSSKCILHCIQFLPN